MRNSGSMFYDSSVVIRAANLFTIAVREFEYNSILLVHANTVKAGEIAPQLFQSIGGRDPQVVDGCESIQQIEFLPPPAPPPAPKPGGCFSVAPVIDGGSRRIPEAADHRHSIPEYPLFMY